MAAIENWVSRAVDWTLYTFGDGPRLLRSKLSADKPISIRAAPAPSGYTGKARQTAKEIVGEYDRSFSLTGRGLTGDQEKREVNELLHRAKIQGPYEERAKRGTRLPQ